MTVVTEYCALDEFRAAANMAGTTDDNHATLTIQAASRWVDLLTGRIFYDTGAATARVYRPTSAYCCLVDDFSTTTGLLVATDFGDNGTYATAWSTTNYELYPLNGVSPAGQAVPYNELRALYTYTFPVGTYHAPVRVTAQWGWATVPNPVKLATIYLAEYLFASASAPFGVAVVGELGALRARMPSVVADLLKGYELGSGLGAPLIG